VPGSTEVNGALNPLAQYLNPQASSLMTILRREKSKVSPVVTEMHHVLALFFEIVVK